MSEYRVYLSPPDVGEEERRLLLEAFDSGWVAPVGPELDAFEQEVAELVGVQDAAAVSTGTAALHLALRLAGVGAGDRVLCPTLTFVASVSPVCYLGATPIFVDADPANWTVDSTLVEEELARAASGGDRLAAVVAVDLYGQCADYGPLEEICSRYEVPLIEDAAEALGASYEGRQAGSFGRCGILSFNGNKIITTSGGGMLLSNDREMISRARRLASQARDPAPHYQHSELGYNYRMSNLLAALGRAQLRSLEGKIAARRAHFQFYTEALGDLPGLSFMPESPRGRSTRWLTCLLVDEEEFGAGREDVRLALEAQNIEARPVWKPMHMQPLFEGALVRGGDVARRLFETGLCLPSGSNLSETDRERVASIVREQQGKGG